MTAVGKGRILGSAISRLTLSLSIGIASVVIVFFFDAPTAILTGTFVTATVFVAAGIVALWPMDATQTARHSRREDFRPSIDELIITAATLLGLGGIVLLLAMGGKEAGLVRAIIALGGVFTSWAALHVMYTARYAYLYYASADTPGGIDFNTKSLPSYSDFFYFSFAVGMTYGVTDTAVSRTDIRSVVLRHSILSYVFGAAVVATAINLVVGAFEG